MKLSKIWLMILALTIVNIVTINAMSRTEKEKGWYIKIDDQIFANALIDGDVETIKGALSEDRSFANKKFKSPAHGFQLASPIEIILDGRLPIEKKHQIVELLLANGADRSLLNSYLRPVYNNLNEVKWLIAQGARDVDGSALQKAKAARARLHPREKTLAATLDEIITILERNG